MVKQPKHACPINGCNAGRGELHVMCREHWYMVPKPLRDLVWHLFRTEQGSQQHLKALADAIRHVNNLLDEKLLA